MKIFCCILIALVLVATTSNAQSIPVSDGQHRVFLNRNDTLYEFYAMRPVKKISISADKMYHWYRPDTILLTQGGFDGRVLFGNYKVIYPNKNMHVKGQFSDGLKDGEWISWYPNGSKESTEHWRKGIRDGNFIRYNPQGELLSSDQYKSGLRQGMQLRYSSQNKWDTTYYKKGRLVKTDSTVHSKNRQ